MHTTHRHYTFLLIFFAAFVFLFSGCIDSLRDPNETLTGSTSVRLRFSFPEEMEVSEMRLSETPVAERHLENVYFFVFNADGSAVEYRNLYTLADLTQVDAKTYETEYVQMRKGQKHMVAIANVPTTAVTSEGLTVSVPDNLKTQLDAITTLSALQNLLVRMPYARKSIFRENSLFIMASEVRTVTFSSQLQQLYTIKVKRLDAKVELRIKKGTNTSNFTLKKWKVVNVPSVARLVEGTTDGSGNVAGDYFSTPEYDAEEVDGVHDGCTFYLYENRKPAKKQIAQTGAAGYRLRSKRLKRSISGGAKENLGFEYAPDYCTYVVLIGEWNGTVATTEDNDWQAGARAKGEVEYTIPLGYLNGAINDYNVARNRHYIYNIEVRGVNEVYVEAKQKNLSGVSDGEKNPAVEGHVYGFPRLSLYVDAHYDRRVWPITVQELLEMAQTPEDFEAFIIRVNTHFGQRTFTVADLRREPNKYGPWVEWVQFAREPMAAKSSGYGSAWRPMEYFYIQEPSFPIRYTVSRPEVDGPFGLLRFIDYLKVNFKAAKAYQTQGHNRETYRNLFGGDKGGEYANFFLFQDPKPGSSGVDLTQAKGKFTVFVDEHYYYKRPDQPGVRPKWQEFVNGLPRTFSIFARRATSVDQKSTYFGPPIMYVQQEPIHTHYLLSNHTEDNGEYFAYGIETYDEADVFTGGFEDHGAHLEDLSQQPNINRWNDVFTGIYNFMGVNNLWGGTRNWDDYFRNIHQFQSQYSIYANDYGVVAWADMAFAECMYRNRDINRNGKIDYNEIRWYLPSIGQLQAISASMEAFPDKVQFERTKTDGRNRQFFVSSTVAGDEAPKKNYFYFLMHNQGINFDNNFEVLGDRNNKRGQYSVRCVRNLNNTPAFDPGTENYRKGTLRMSALRRDTRKNLNYVDLSLLTQRALRPPYEFVESGSLKKHTVYTQNKGIVRPMRTFYIASAPLKDGANIRTYSRASIVNMIKSNPAQDPCHSYSESGVSGWRMPSIYELYYYYSAAYGTNPHPGTPNAFRLFSCTLTENQNGVVGTTEALRWQENGGYFVFTQYSNMEADQVGAIRCVKDRR